jgi:hypothetical protein
VTRQLYLRRYDDQPVAARDWLRRGYSSLATWLQSGSGPTFQVGTVALWSLCSWDAIGEQSSAGQRVEAVENKGGEGGGGFLCDRQQ